MIDRKSWSKPRHLYICEIVRLANLNEHLESLERTSKRSLPTLQREKIWYYEKGWKMPQKIRELKALLSKAGFASRPAKGSHVFWYYPSAPEVNLTLAGHDGDDAQPYQVKYVRQALKRLRGEL